MKVITHSETAEPFFRRRKPWQRDLNAFGGFSDRSVHQRIRGTEANRFTGGVGHETLKFADRTWRE